MALTTTRISTVQTIFHSDELAPLLGSESTDSGYEFTPWSWDERIWTTDKLENSDLTIPSLADASRGALSSSYWQSGVGNLRTDCEVIQPVIVRQESLDRWTVQVRHGNYFSRHQKRYLFADRSSVQYVDPDDNEVGVNTLLLTDVPRNGSPISATIWTRDSYGSPFLKKYINKRCHFTGWYTVDGEADTDDNGDIEWANVDTTKDEFIVVWPDDMSDPTLWFNKDFTFLVGKDTISEDDDLAACDHVGTGDGVNTAFLAEYFPICDNAEFTVYSDTFSTIVDPDDYEFDYDRGEISFDTAPANGTEIYIRYRVTVEVEYESEHCNDYCTAGYINLNPMTSIIDRGFIYLTEQELRVARLTLHAELAEIDEDVYGPLELGTDYCFLVATAYNMYGQVVPGAEVSFWLDSDTSGYINGSTALTGSEVEVMTDANGEARILYSVPRSVESVGQYVGHSLGDEDNELTLVQTDGIDEDDLSNIFVFYVFDDDPSWNGWTDVTQPDGSIGYGGRKVVLYRQNFKAAPWAGSTVYYAGDYNDPTSYVHESGNFYKCLVTHTSSADSNPATGAAAVAYWQFIGTSDYSWGGGATLYGDKFWSDSAYNPVSEILGAYIPLQPTGIIGNQLIFDDELYNPITLPVTNTPHNQGISLWQTGQSYLTNGEVIGTDNKRYKCLTNHSSSSSNQPPHPTYWQHNEKPGNLVAYWITGGKYIVAHAKVFSYFYNAYVSSNDISLQVTIPEHMTGVYINEQLQKVPYGFRLYSDSGNMSSALTGITFLGINF